jgi:hypothetical protein
MNSSARWAIGVSVTVGLMMVAMALNFWGAKEIRSSPDEVVVLTLVAAAWLLIAMRLFSWLGLSFKDDAVDRKNIAALIVLCGAVISMALIYAGGSIGEGPSYWNNFFSAGLGTLGLFGLWILLELGGKPSISITEDRDAASGLRLCCFLLAVGLILGRAVAGNWHSESETVHDFIHDGWPAALICATAILVELFARPNRSRPFPDLPIHGLIPGGAYLALAAAWLRHLGAWEGMPK